MQSCGVPIWLLTLCSKMVVQFDAKFSEYVTQLNESWLEWARSHVIPKDVELDTEKVEEMKSIQFRGVSSSHERDIHGVTSVDDLHQKSNGNR